MHAQFDLVGAPHDLVQLLPAPITKESTAALMRQCDLVVVTGSQANVRAAYASGTPTFGVGAGNVASIVDETANVPAAAERIVRSKTFDNATSCSSENSVVVVRAAQAALLHSFETLGAVQLNQAQQQALEHCMWPDGKLSAAVIGQSAQAIAATLAAQLRTANPLLAEQFAGIAERDPSILLVHETGFGSAHPFSGEKLCPVLAVYTVEDFAQACTTVERIYAYQGAGHSVSLHSANRERALTLGLRLPVARVIVDQAHCIATGGSFDNGLPFSLSMGCGTWGKNNFSENMGYKHYLNITRVSTPITEVVPTQAQIFGEFIAKYGAN
jgi:sulfoacetaldehyde dehydrogenase